MKLGSYAFAGLLGIASSGAFAQGFGRPVIVADPVAAMSGRAPWSGEYEYDSGSGNDHHPQLPYYQQGRGQQTGGPERNRLWRDGYVLSPR